MQLKDRIQKVSYKDKLSFLKIYKWSSCIEKVWTISASTTLRFVGPIYLSFVHPL